jgi:hypothetical protein
VSKGDEKRREGSLAVHVPADLMNYCERAGLTGKLVFRREDRSAEAVYDRGELAAIRVDGTDDADLHEVFGWEEGVFEIVAHAATPKLDVDELVGWEDEVDEDPADREPTIQFQRKRRKQDTAEIFLRSVEVALTSILEEREKRRAPARTSPPLPPPKKARTSSAPGLEAVPKIEPPRRKEPTVRIVFLGAKAPKKDDDTGTRHVKKGAQAERMLPAAARERAQGDTMKDRKKKGGRGSSASKHAAAKSSGASKKAPAAEVQAKAAPDSTVETLAWVLAFFALVIGALALLARLPPLR